MPDVRSAHGYHPLLVKRVVDETLDTKSFVLDVPEELVEQFAYRPGQFCTFRIRLGDDEHLRSYSMSSAPEMDGDLTVTVKRVPGGLISNWFLDHVAAGDTVELTRPAGVFCLGDAERPVIAFCGGSGVTPVMSLAKSALYSTGRSVRIFYANRDRDALIFAGLLEDLGRRHPGRLEVEHHIDAESGYPSSGQLAKFVGSDAHAEFYICGPAPFMELAEKVLVDLGVQPDRIHIERFSVEPPVAGEATETSGEITVTVILKGRKTEVRYKGGDSLLETARRGGLQPPFSCQAGDCATCMAMLKEGTVTMRANNALTDDEVAEGWVLTCQSVPTSERIVVEYESL
jgi:3-ketosteroid 9alpha-monooxygenase subunit B